MQKGDNSYISEYLIHWTGKKGNQRGVEIISTIAETYQLLLSYNPLFAYDFCHEIHEKMVCFTDVPLRYSERHCSRYGRFGIAFHKLRLINHGAQPVFYFTHNAKDDLNKIFRFLEAQMEKTTIDGKVFKALHRHFYFMQPLSKGKADEKDTYYYEREWRLGEQTLVPKETLSRPNAKYWLREEGYPPHIGLKVQKKDKTYFQFEPDDVAFLVIPRDWICRIRNPHRFGVRTYEDLVPSEENRTK